MATVTNVSFSIDLDGGHVALVDDPQGEVCRILDAIKQKITDGYTDGSVHDLNGNDIGQWCLDVEEEGEEE